MIYSLLLLAAFGPADLDHARGMALARAGRWPEAEAAFLRGQREAPRDKRFPVELAGVAFKRRDFDASRRHIRRALVLDPGDSYSNDFAGTLALLDGNIEAALQYWNRIGKPRLERIRLEPEPGIDPVLLDRAFSFAPASTLALEDYRVTRARLALLDAFPVWTLALEPRADGDAFDAVLRTVQTRSWLAALRGLPFATVYPEFRLPGRGVIRVRSLLRWDSQKRRAGLALSGPLARRPAWHWRLFADGRNENWALPGDSGFNMKRAEAGGEIETVTNSRLRWSAGASVAHRRFTNSSFAPGSSLAAHTAASVALLRLPERRLSVEADGRTELGRFFGRGLYSRPQGSLLARWFPRARGDDYETSAQFRAGAATGRVPFDELFMLGIERDNGLWLRAHAGTAGGRKGSAPLGPRFALANWELAKIVRQGALYSVRFGPFFDTGRVWGAPGARFGYAGWMFDAGLQAELRFPGLARIVFTWGKDLRTGRNVWYATPR
ncbi:MAG TPA: hypothetical protein VF767_05200 [Bryobacteraceae bacterium]